MISAPGANKQFNITGFTQYAMKNKQLIMLEYPSLTQLEVTQKLAAQWACLPLAEKLIYGDDGVVSNTSTRGFDFPFEELQNPAEAEEAVICAASMIQQMEQPVDPTGYIMWLGSHVITQYVQAHGELPPDLAQKLAKGHFVAPIATKETTDSNHTLSKQQIQNPVLGSPLQ